MAQPALSGRTSSGEPVGRARGSDYDGAMVFLPDHDRPTQARRMTGLACLSTRSDPVDKGKSERGFRLCALGLVRCRQGVLSVADSALAVSPVRGNDEG